jgi:hypothetical protein
MQLQAGLLVVDIPSIEIVSGSMGMLLSSQVVLVTMKRYCLVCTINLI